MTLFELCIQYRTKSILSSTCSLDLKGEPTPTTPEVIVSARPGICFPSAERTETEPVESREKIASSKPLRRPASVLTPLPSLSSQPSGPPPRAPWRSYHSLACDGMLLHHSLQGAVFYDIGIYVACRQYTLKIYTDQQG